jgi:hypothetical protein
MLLHVAGHSACHKKDTFVLAVSARHTLSYISHTPTSARRPAGWWRARCFSAVTVVWGGTSVQSAASTYGPQRLFIFRSRLFKPAKKLKLNHGRYNGSCVCGWRS